MMKKNILVPVIAATLLIGLGGLTASNVYADESEVGFPPMIQRFVERFNLNSDEVEAFIQEERSERMAERKGELDERLSQAVAEGTITEEQKTLIQEKIEENHAERQNLDRSDREAMNNYRETHREEMQAWAEENGIDMSELNLGKGGEGAPGHKMRGGMKGIEL